MSNQNNGETHVKILTDVCQNVCSFIKTITGDNMSKDEKIISLETKIDDLQCLCSNLKTQLEHINENVKTLASLLNFTVDQDDSVVNILTRWILSLSKKKLENTKKRKLYSSYSPLKLSLKDKTAVNEGTPNGSEKEYKNSSQNEFKNVWKLQIKRDGKPSDLLKKSKQTTIATLFRPKEEKDKMDITAFSSATPKRSVLNSTGSLSPEVLGIKNDGTTNVCENSLIPVTQNDNSANISLSHFNKIIKSDKNILPIVKTNILKSNEFKTPDDQTEKYNQSSTDESVCSPVNISVNVLKNKITSKQQRKISNRNLLDSFDIIPGLNDKQDDLPNYKFKEDPVRKRNKRKLLNGWDCENCCKFYEANNDNAVEAKSAMNHFSRHRSVKHQHQAPTPPGFWDPI